MCALGLSMLAAAFAWVSTVDVDVSYLEVAAQMVLLGGGLGLTTAPATDSIMGVVRPEQAGAGSAVNDATRQVGGTLGVAVVGSIFSTLYTGGLGDDPAVAALPQALRGLAARAWPRDWGRGPVARTRRVGAACRGQRRVPVRSRHAGCVTAAAVCLAGAVFVAAFLPAHPRSELPA